MLFDRSTWPQHRPWFVTYVLILGAAVAWFWKESETRTDWAGGSTLAGFTFGVIGGLIILFEWLLWFRKKKRTWRVGSAAAWLRAHIWLGLLCLPLLILHSGLRLGGTLSTVLMILLALVVASGIGGLILQNLLPRRLLDDLPADTLFTQLDYLVAQLHADADEMVSATCGVPAEPSRHAAITGIVGTVRLASRRVPATPIPESEPLAAFYRDQVSPFLRDGSASESPLASAGRAAVLFQSCKSQLPRAAHEIVDALEGFCQQRRNWDRQARLHFWLHCWLWLHFPLSVALVVLMAAHIFVALKFW